MLINSVVAGVVVARWLGAKGVGELAVINVAIFTLVQLGSFGLPSANTYFIAQSQKQIWVGCGELISVCVNCRIRSRIWIIFPGFRRLDLFGFVSPQLIQDRCDIDPFSVDHSDRTERATGGRSNQRIQSTGSR